MNTLVSSLALWISIFALTSSFSLSTESDNENLSSDDTAFHEIIPHLKKLPPQKDQNRWVFKHVYHDLSTFRQFVTGWPGYLVYVDHFKFKDKITSLVTGRLNLEAGDLYSAFKIYKVEEPEQQQVIGLIFKEIDNEKYSEKLVLYDKEFNLLDIPYTKLIENKKVDVSDSDKDPIRFYGHLGQECILSMKWKGDKDHTYIKMSYNKEGDVQMAALNPKEIDLIEPLTRGHSDLNDARKNTIPQNNNQNTGSTLYQARKMISQKAQGSNIDHKTSKDEESVKTNDKKVVGFLLIGLAIYIYNKGYFSKKSKKSNKDAR